MALLLKCVRCEEEFYASDGTASCRCPQCHAVNHLRDAIEESDSIGPIVWLLVAVALFAAIASNPPPDSIFRVIAPGESESSSGRH